MSNHTMLVRFTGEIPDAELELFADPPTGGAFSAWRARRPFDVAWANHEALRPGP